MEKKIWADNLRVLAMIAVIIGHVSGPILHEYGSVSDSTWWIGNIYDSMIRFSIPVFTMLTGALMLSKEYELTYFLKKRFTRILLPFIFWSLIYISIEFITKMNNGTQISIIEMCKFVVLRLLKGGSAVHLWYVYMIIGIYLVFPIINKWIIHSTNKEIIYFLIFCTIGIFFRIPVLNELYPKIDLSYFSGYLGYVILGYFLTTKIDYRKKMLPLVLFLLGIIATMVGTYIVTKEKGFFYEGFYSAFSPTVILASIGFFLLIKNWDFKSKIWTKTIQFISKYSYGIYLSHFLVLIFLYRIGLDWSFISPIISIPIITTICLVISLCITFVLHKIPITKHVSG